MTARDDHDDLASLWSEAAPIEEREEFARLARGTPARARLIQYGDLAVLILLIAAIIAAIIARLGPTMVLTGGLVILVLGWAGWKRHQLARLSLLIDESDRFTLVQSHIRAKQAELRRSRIGIVLLVPTTVLALLMGRAFVEGPRFADMLRVLPDMLVEPRNLLAIGFLAIAMLMMRRAHARLRDELTRLCALRDAYQQEKDADGGA